MKQLLSFDEFLNEGKVLSPKNIKEYNFNKNSVKDLKNWTYKIKDLSFKFKDFEYYGETPSFERFMQNPKDRLYDYFRLTVNDLNDLNVRLNICTIKENIVDVYSGSITINLTTDVNTIKQYNLKYSENSVKAILELINYLFEKYETEIYKELNKIINISELYVINAGEISPSTGKTAHGWSIYDNPKGVLLYGDDRSLLYTSGVGNIKIGDSFKVLNDQTHKVLYNVFTVKDIIECNYNAYVNFCKRQGAKIPIRSFAKQPGSYNFTLLSIK